MVAWPSLVVTSTVFQYSKTGCLASHPFISQLLLFTVRADESLQKDVLSCSQVSLSRWKTKYLSDTELDPGLSSEDEAVGLPLHKAVAWRLPGSRGRETVQTSTLTQATGDPSEGVSAAGGESDSEPPAPEISAVSAAGGESDSEPPAPEISAGKHLVMSGHI